MTKPFKKDPVKSSIWFYSAAILIVLPVIIYYQSSFFNLTGCDDKLLISYVSALQKEGIISGSFGKPYLFENGLFYRPLVELSVAADILIKNSSQIFHISNLAYHIIASFIFFILLINLNINKDVALILAVIFAVHPVSSGIAGWIPGRNDSLLAVFLFADFIFFIKYLKDGNVYYLILHILFFLLALFTKETAFILPVICFLYYFLLYRKGNLKKKESFILLPVLWVIVLSAWYFIKSSVIKSALTIDLFRNIPFLIQGLGKCVLPFNLSVLPVISDTTYIFGTVSILLIITLIIVTKNRNYRFIVFSLLWYLLFLVPSLLNINPEYSSDLMLEERLYLPLAGILIFFSQTVLLKEFSLKRRYHLIPVLIIIAVFSFLSYNYIKPYHDDESFWLNAVENSPSLDLSHSGLGLIYLQRERYDLAEPEYKRAAEISPQKAGYNGKIAFILTREDKIDEAEKYYILELGINPTDKEANLIMGIISYKKNKLDESEKYFLACLSQNPSDLQPQLYLMKLYHQKGNFEESLKYAKRLKSKGVKIPENIIKDLRLE